MFKVKGDIFTMQHKADFIEAVKNSGLDTCTMHRRNKSYKVYNVPASFDIETTSTEIMNQKIAYMYIWQFGINGYVIFGRTWDEFKELVKLLNQELTLSDELRLPVYVHNLNFEHSFIKSIFNFSDIFKIDGRGVAYAAIEEGLEFRCSYMLTGLNLYEVGKNLKKYRCNKQVGDLDYRKIRHHLTRLTRKEIMYAIYDVRVVMCDIMERIEAEGNIAKIPMTKTGYVRRDVRNAVLGNRMAKRVIQDLKLTVEEYEMAEAALASGFVHSNFVYNSEVVENVKSKDITSDYIAIMASEPFPMSNGKKVVPESYEEFEDYIANYCCLMTLSFDNLRVKDNAPDGIISECNAEIVGDSLIDNGRVRKADSLTITVTEQDYLNICEYYDFDPDFYVVDMYIYKKRYLPTVIIEKALEYFEKKNLLKGVPGMETEYNWNKTNLNAIFGMMIAKIVHEGEDKAEAIENYNNSKTRFNWFPWGVWICAYARRRLLQAILECGDDYVYSDTDSVKYINAEAHEEYFDYDNAVTTYKLKRALTFLGIDTNKLTPNGKCLGDWEDDGDYKRFKTIGAKRYMYEDQDGVIHTTVSGLSKKAGLEYYNKIDNPFDEFADQKQIPVEYAQSFRSVYLEDEITADITDYQGNTATVKSIGGIHISPVPFSYSIGHDYLDFLILFGKVAINEY